jgi:nucleoside-diphosphate-sugar epimerase
VHAILGAGGAVGAELVTLLVAAGRPVRLVGRNPRPLAGAQIFAADLADRARCIEAVAGAKVAYLLAGLKYDTTVWRELWPRIMANAIEACKRAGARLMFFDNVYMYGRVAGPMTEATPFNPCSAKGEVRAQIASTLLDEIRAGGLTAMLARSADFYGPGAQRTGIANILVFERLAKGQAAFWMMNDAAPHSLTYTPDAARALALLAGTESAWNQTWHLPTAPNPPDGRALVALAAKALGVEPRHKVLGRAMAMVGGWFNADVRESREMLYQYELEYLFDSGKFTGAFGVQPTPYAEGVGLTAQAYRRR